MSRLRCAIYSRFSSDRQSPTSIDDQVRKCRAYAERQDWRVLDDHLYSDEAICGDSTDRAVCRNYWPRRPDRRARLIAF
jgi:site-specific DNA recombinase